MDKNQSPNPLSWGSLDGPKSRDTDSWASQATQKKMGMKAAEEDDFTDPANIPGYDRVITFCKFMIYTQEYKAERASEIVDYYLHFLEAHPEFKHD